MVNYIASSLEGYIQEIAVGHVARGYRYYVPGYVQEGCEAAVLDSKLIAKFGCGVSKWAHARLYCQGYAKVRYIRWERHWVMLATPGTHGEFSRSEMVSIRDFQASPLVVRGYCVALRGGKVEVGIARRHLREIRARLLELAARASRASLEDEFIRIPYARYSLVSRQLLQLLRDVNGVRRRHGYEAARKRCLALGSRRTVSVFAPREGEADYDGT